MMSVYVCVIAYKRYGYKLNQNLSIFFIINRCISCVISLCADLHKNRNKLHREKRRAGSDLKGPSMCYHPLQSDITIFAIIIRFIAD